MIHFKPSVFQFNFHGLEKTWKKHQLENLENISGQKYCLYLYIRLLGNSVENIRLATRHESHHRNNLLLRMGGESRDIR